MKSALQAPRVGGLNTRGGFTATWYGLTSFFVTCLLSADVVAGTAVVLRTSFATMTGPLLLTTGGGVGRENFFLANKIVVAAAELVATAAGLSGIAGAVVVDRGASILRLVLVNKRLVDAGTGAGETGFDAAGWEAVGVGTTDVDVGGLEDTGVGAVVGLENTGVAAVGFEATGGVEAIGVTGVEPVDGAAGLETTGVGIVGLKPNEYPGCWNAAGVAVVGLTTTGGAVNGFEAAGASTGGCDITGVAIEVDATG